jgi:hypothetical protein
MKKTHEIIEDLTEEIKRLQKMIGIKDIIIENYRTITEVHKNIVKKEDKNKTEILQMMEEDSRNTMDIANAFLIVQKQNIKLLNEIRNYKEVNTYNKRLN